MKQTLIFLTAFLVFGPPMFSQATEKNEVVNTLAESDSMKLGEELLLEDISIKFIKVISDSRCPESVTCIWEGEAEVLLGINFNQAYFEKQVVVKGSTSEVLEMGNLQLSLLYLDPYPVTPKKINPKDYSLGLQLNIAP